MALLEFCKSSELSELVYEINRAKIICYTGFTYYCERESHGRNYEQLRTYQSFINKLSYENFRDRKLRKLLKLLDGKIYELNVSTV